MRLSSANALKYSNTKWKNVKTGTLKAGQKCRVEWRFPNVLKSGRYRLTTATAHDDGVGFYDWQDDVLSFDVSRPEQTAGLVVVDDVISVKNVR
jgi:hypothetical protein